MGTVCGLQPEDDFFHSTLKLNWIYQWMWVLLFLDWIGFYMAAVVDDEPAVSGCFFPGVKCDFVHANTDEPYDGPTPNPLAIATVIFYLCATGTFTLLCAQIISCLIGHGEAIGKHLKGGDDDDDDSDSDDDDDGFKAQFRRRFRCSKRTKGCLEVIFMLVTIPAMVFTQMGCLGLTIYKYVLLGGIPGTNWFARVVEVMWLGIVFITAIRLEYLKTVKKVKTALGFFGDEDDSDFSDDSDMLDPDIPCANCVDCCVKCNSWTSLCCKGERERDPLWVIGCDSPIRHIWFVTIFLDWAQTFSYLHYEGEYLGDIHVKTFFAIPSLLFTIWGTALLITAQMSRCQALHMENNGASSKKVDDAKMISSVLSMADAIWDEVPNATLTILFWASGGLSGPDYVTSSLSVVQFLFALTTFALHAAGTWAGYAEKADDDIRHRRSSGRGVSFMRGGHLYIPGVTSNNCCQVTWLGGFCLGLIAPLLPFLFLIAFCSRRNTLIDVLVDLKCYSCMIQCCCTGMEITYEDEENPVGGDKPRRRVDFATKARRKQWMSAKSVDSGEETSD